MSVYGSPEDHGLEMVGEVQWGEAVYSFDLTAVWRDKATGELFYADDSGCSCPSPFEAFYDRDALTAATRHEVLAHLQDKTRTASPSDAAELIERINALAVRS